LTVAARAVCETRAEVVAVYLYGSTARGEAASDVDLAPLLRHGAAASVCDRMAAEFARIADTGGLEVDMRPLRGTSPRFRANVLREGRVIYQRDLAARLQFEAQSLTEWLDFKPTWEALRAQMFRRWTHG
jgi:predicted nucleotidyltransferase